MDAHQPHPSQLGRVHITGLPPPCPQGAGGRRTRWSEDVRSHPSSGTTSARGNRRWRQPGWFGYSDRLQVMLTRRRRPTGSRRSWEIAARTPTALADGEFCATASWVGFPPRRALRASGQVHSPVPERAARVIRICSDATLARCEAGAMAPT